MRYTEERSSTAKRHLSDERLGSDDVVSGVFGQPNAPQSMQARKGDGQTIIDRDEIWKRIGPNRQSGRRDGHVDRGEHELENGHPSTGDWRPNRDHRSHSTDRSSCDPSATDANRLEEGKLAGLDRRDGPCRTNGYRPNGRNERDDAEPILLTDGGTESGSESGSTGRRTPESLIVVSNRQPYRHEFVENEGEEAVSNVDRDSAQLRTDGSSTGIEGDEAESLPITVEEPAGGLTAGLDPVLREVNGTWIAWGDGEADRVVTDDRDCVPVPPDDQSYQLRRLWLSDRAIDAYYYGFSNQVLWPMCHGFTDLIQDNTEYIDWYWQVNSRFADAVETHAEDEAVVWLQDYHLGFAPRLIRDRLSDSVTVAQFWHIPWPTAHDYQSCPVEAALLDGLLGNDLLGFHVDRYADNFLDCVDRYLDGVRVDRDRRRIESDGHETRLVSSPMGVDARSQAKTVEENDPSRWVDLCDEYEIPRGSTIGLGIDRLDYTKGIPHRLRALERFFDQHPDWRGTFTFVQKATPSRTGIPAYDRHGEYVRAEVDRINDRFRTDVWQPIVYTEDVLPREDLCELYHRADLMVVSPLIDGMNLVAQEFVAASVDERGALLLSERTGAHDTLGDNAYTIDPTNVEEFADTIERALDTPAREQRTRMKKLRQQVFANDLDSWMTAQFDHIASVHGRDDSGRDRSSRVYTQR